MKISIIDDEENLAKNLKLALNKEGYIVDYFLDGLEGQNYIELNHETLDLLILDLTLGDEISGVDICKKLRSENINVPILMLTARFDIKDRVKGLNAGADDYLIKPFSFEELIARIKALVRRPKAILFNELKVGKLVLNSITNEVRIDDQIVKLTLKEFRLLEYLMRNPNQVVSREVILENLWDYGFDSFSNVVDVHIKNLRKKINNNNSASLETIRGVGYKIRA